jgi:hypothetical protein
LLKFRGHAVQMRHTLAFKIAHQRAQRILRGATGPGRTARAPLAVSIHDVLLEYEAVVNHGCVQGKCRSPIA